MQEKDVFGKFIKQKRIQSGLSQKELASKLFVTESAVSKWERGISYPDITLVQDICTALSISEHELITASEDVHQREIEKKIAFWEKFKKIVFWSSSIFCCLWMLVSIILEVALKSNFIWTLNSLGVMAILFSVTGLPNIVKNKKLTKSVLLALAGILLIIIVEKLYANVFIYPDYYQHYNFFGYPFNVHINRMIASIQWTIFAFVLVFLPICIREFKLPKFISNHKALFCMFIDTLLLCSFVLFNPFQDFNTSIPYLIIAISSCVPVWVFFITIRYLRLNGLFKASICLFFASIYVIYANSMVQMLSLGGPFSIEISEAQKLNFIFFAILGLIFLIGGILYAKKKKNEKLDMPHFH